jgi:4-aminobutyrate--pyruvate transaminase
VPPETYFPKIQEVLDRYDVRLISDEVICGFGRLGTWFGAEAMEMRPHSISVAKALSSAYMPIGAVLIDEPMYQALVDESAKLGTFGHGTTYSGHPVTAAVALKTLEIYERDDIIGQVNRVIPTFQRRLKALGDHSLVGEARGKGLVGALELVADKATKGSFEAKKGVAAKAVAFAQDEGLILRNVSGDAVTICPPLIISEEEVNLLFDRLETALDRAEAWVAKEGLRAA